MNLFQHRHNKHANGLCNKIRIEEKADRVVCFIAHNGGHAEQGWTFSKFSLFFQSISDGNRHREQIVSKNTSVPSSVFASVAEHCLSPELRGVTIEKADIFEDPIVSSLLIDEEVKSCVYFPAIERKDERQTIHAIIRIDWFEEKKLSRLPVPRVLYDKYYESIFREIVNYKPRKK